MPINKTVIARDCYTNIYDRDDHYDQDYIEISVGGL